jgi:SOS response regulatory protein OraA/RecX
VTALRERRGGKLVDVELDGAPWRALPLDVAARVGLREGTELDRPRARELRRELRRAEALGTAVSALRRRDLPRARLEQRLAQRGIGGAPAAEALETLERAGYVDDQRVAHGRAAALAERGLGDEAIRWDLERQGLDEALATAALAALEPEAARARRIATKRGRTASVARSLARKGFSQESLEAAFGEVVADGA